MTELETSEKEYLLSFLESHYDIPREDIHEHLDGDGLPENPRELPFVRRKIIYSNDETVGSFTSEFHSRVQYLEDLMRLNLDHPPSFRDGYVKQISISDHQRMRARDNPNLTTKSLVDDDQYDELIDTIENHIEFLLSEVENCAFDEEVQQQLHLIIALMRYSINNRTSADIKNSFRPLKYISSNKNLSEGRQSHAYSKIGHKLDFMFEDKDTIPEELLPYYEKSIKSLVSVIEKSLESHE